MHFQSSSLCIYTSLSTFRNPESKFSKTTPAFNIENEWSNFKEYIIGVEEEEWDENNIREFIKLIGQHKQAWKPAREELETIDVDNEKLKEKLKIGIMITPKVIEELIALF
jgi:hypothetical protein